MGEHYVERRMAAILAADVAGYGRLTEADEEGTHVRLKAHRRELLDPKFKEHHGRIVQSAGDGALVEFPSVAEAVRCAIEVQHGMAERNAKTPKRERIEFRIGINLGDIILEEEDIYGNGVNIAVRLENLARPGSIYISGTAFDQVGNGISRRCKFLGAQRVKNIAKPVRVYRIRLERSGTATALWRRWRTELVGGAALLIVIGIAGTANMRYHASLTESATMPPGTKSEAQGLTKPSELPKETPPLDVQVWQAIRDSTDREAFEAFLRIFPNGAVADLARERLRALAPEHYPSASTTRPTSAAPAPAPLRQRIASRSDPPPDPPPQPQAIATSPVPVALPALRSSDRSDGTTSTTPTRAPQQQAAIPPSSSNPVTNPALAGAPYDGEWKGTALAGHICNATTCGGNVKATVAKNAVNGKMEFGSGDLQLSGTIANDGSFDGKLGAIDISGKFEKDRFEGVTQPQVGAEIPGSGAAILLERVKRGDDATRQGADASTKGDRDQTGSAPVPAPHPPASTDVSTSTMPTRTPQQQAAIPPSSSNPVTNPALLRARFDGKWQGRTIGQTGCNSAIGVTVANGTASGQITFGTYGGNTEVSGTVSDDGAFAGRVADATLSGRFEEDRFEGVFSKPGARIASVVTGMGSSGQYCTDMLVILERVKRGDVATRPGTDASAKGDRDQMDSAPVPAPQPPAAGASPSPFPTASSRIAALSPPSESAVVPSRPSGPFDGQWKGTGFMGPSCFSHSVDVVLTIVGHKVSGQLVSFLDTSPVSGEIRDDGSLMSRFGAGVIEGKFEGGVFRGTSLFSSAAAASAYSAASEALGSGCRAEIILERMK